MHFISGGSSADLTTAPLHLFILKFSELLNVSTKALLGFLSVKHLEFLYNVLSMMELERLLFEARRLLLLRVLPLAT